MRILGIDLGSSSVKAVELDSSFGRFEIRDYHENKIEPGAAPTEALQQLINGLVKKPDRIAVAMPTGQMTFRNFVLPTKGKKAINAAIAFELEDELPFPMDNVTYSSSMLTQNKQGTHVHVAATLRQNLASFLHVWAAAEIDPDLVTTELWAYRALMNRVITQNPSVGERPILFAQIGHEKTILYAHWDGAPVFARSIPIGGRDISMAISEKYSISLLQAEQTKLDHGFVSSSSQQQDLTPEQVEFSETITQPLRQLILEIRQNILSCRSVTHHRFGKLYVAGGVALLPGLCQLFEEELHVQVLPLRALSSIAATGVTYSEQTDAQFTGALALALSLAAPDKVAPLNLRTGDFAKQSDTGSMKLANVRSVIASATVVMLSTLISFCAQSSSYKKQLNATNVQLESNVRSFFGQLSSSALRTYMASTTELRKKINADIIKEKQLNQLIGPNAHSPIDFLKELSTAISKDVIVDMTQFQVGAAPATNYSPTAERTTTLSFLVASPQVAEKLEALLKTKISELEQQGKTEEIVLADGATKKWKVTFAGKPLETAYGDSYGK